MNTKIRNWVIIIIVLVVIGSAGFVLFSQNNQPSKFDDFAKCLSEKGEKFYGAFWCPHCQDQKALFGSSEKYLPYIECSTPDSKGQIKVCSDDGIRAYPTWKFHNGTTKEGEISLEELADISGCVLPK